MQESSSGSLSYVEQLTPFNVAQNRVVVFAQLILRTLRVATMLLS